MIDRIILFSVNKKLTVLSITVFFVLFGIYSAFKLKIDAVPDITNNQVQIAIKSPKLSPQEIETYVTTPTELKLINLPKVEKIRSISRYALAVITVVFEEDFPIMEARQLISEQIKVIEEDIPKGIAKIEMLPITTGLGEVYQYNLQVDENYKDKYSLLDLRTIQDWIVKRQLSGIKGIIEISTFGGHLKQYEISLNPIKMKALNITTNEVIEAMEKSNQNIGASYINKGSKSYFIRTEGLVKSKEDIEDIVVKKREFPILIKDIADVNIEKAIRYGALTKDGQGEVVGGIALLLKGGNAMESIKLIEDRVKQINENLPEGISINPYLERGNLINKTINTVIKNLVEGILIVIFILFIFLGNIRAGFIIASIIPLSLLFAISGMHLLGISANLMSLGAIDFGIVIDGAIIIIEAIVYNLRKKIKEYAMKGGQINMDLVVTQASIGIRKSASLGELIILIVYLPILALKGIEGKMFIPMAQVVCLCIVGALIFSLTYIPAISSIILNKESSSKTYFFDKMMDRMKIKYLKILSVILEHRMKVLYFSICIFLISLFLFSRLGGQFIPTLKEGSIAIQVSLPPGSSLEKSIQTSTQIERIIKDNFPEVISVVSKIGSSEVPTDPMGIESMDIAIILKDKSEWVSAKTQDKIADLIKEKLGILKEINTELTQPIQLRFNELLSGVKSGIAIKILGENLEYIYYKAEEAKSLIKNVEGIDDIKIENVLGLPQLIIKFDYDKIKRYGLKVRDINQVIETAYAGVKVGDIFEGEKKFDIVVRQDKKFINKLDLYILEIKLPYDNAYIPISEVCQIQYVKGPVQINKENSSKYVSININSRSRDVKSIISDVDDILSKKMKLDPGYYIEYAGEFKNFEDAIDRLSFIVPLCLLMVFLVLIISFKSMKNTLLIFAIAILSTFGSISTLIINDLAFSISAAIGFIVVLGVSVLNGIVMISCFNKLSQNNKYDLKQLVLKGAMSRLKPILMTATVAAFGFLPMALSTSEGAEVQRPLARIVIGGIIGSVFLTLLVLPSLYYLFNLKKPLKINPKVVYFIFFVIMPMLSYSQDKVIKLSDKQAVEMAINNSTTIKNIKLDKEKISPWKAIYFYPLKINYDEKYLKNDFIDADDAKIINLKQRIGSLIKMYYDFVLEKQRGRYLEVNENIEKLKLEANVMTTYNSWLYSRSKYEIINKKLEGVNKVIELFKKSNQVKEASSFEKKSAKIKLYKINLELIDAKKEIIKFENALKSLLLIKDSIAPIYNNYLTYKVSKKKKLNNSLLTKLNNYEIDIINNEINSQWAALFPEFAFSWGMGFEPSTYSYNNYNEISFEISIPILSFNKFYEIKKKKINKNIIINNQQQKKIDIINEYENNKQILMDLENTLIGIDYFDDSEYLETLYDSFEEGNIDIFNYYQELFIYQDAVIDYMNQLKYRNEVLILLNYFENLI